MKRLSLVILSITLTLLACQTATDTKIQSVKIEPKNHFTGRGNKQEVLLRTDIEFEGETIDLQSIKLDFRGTTNLKDVEKLKIYATDTETIFDERIDTNASLLANYTPKTEQIRCKIGKKLSQTQNRLWICCSVADNASEGNLIQVSLQEIKAGNKVYSVDTMEVRAKREILLGRKIIYMPGDFESKNWRIPALITAKDGSLVIASDKRKYNQDDLPQDIDIVINRSTDNGKTWSEPLTLVRGEGRGKGFGDAALAHTNEANGLLAVFVGGDGLWESVVQPDKKIRSYMSKSNDNGISWSQPIDITHFIYGEDCQDVARKEWKASFFASGNGLLTHSGRIIFVAAVRELNNWELSNYAVFSDDNGATWQVSNRASMGGDEAKIVELTDGTLLMSIRHRGKRWYNRSTDNGTTWQSTVSEWEDLVEPACNGDLIRYSSVALGGDKDRLLHSFPDDSVRRNVTVAISYDEGKTWARRKSICPHGSAYSSLAVLPDQTIGVYLEEDLDGTGAYSLCFHRFSLAWLTNGNDSCVKKCEKEGKIEE